MVPSMAVNAGQSPDVLNLDYFFCIRIASSTLNLFLLQLMLYSILVLSTNSCLILIAILWSHVMQT